MANTVAPLNPEKWVSDVQDWLNAELVIKPIANMRFKRMLSSGDRINWPTITDQRVQDYTPCTDVTIDDFTAEQSYMDIDNSLVSTTCIDPVEVKQAEDKGYPSKLARQAAHVISQRVDQDGFAEAQTEAANTIAGGTLTAANIFQNFTEATAELQRSNAADGPLFAVIDPERVALLAQSEATDGFNLADSSLKNGFVGNSSAGFRVYNSNNLPYTVNLTVDTQPTNLDTFTIGGVTWTCVTDGTAANPGEINIGANLADFQAIFLTAIAGTTPPTAGDYVDVSVANRRKLQNAQVAAGAWAANVSAITSFGKISGSETFTAGTNVFGTETNSIFFGRVGAISVGMQMAPSLRIRPEPKNLSENYLTHTLYGVKVFSRDAERLVNMTINT